MDREDGGDGFDLQDKLVCDDDIRLEAVADRCAFINDGNCDLPREAKARLAQFAAQALLVDEYQQAGASMAVHLDRQADHPIGQWFRQSVRLAP